MVDDINGIGEENRVALQASGVAQGGGQVGFAQARTAHENHVGLVLEKRETEEILDLGAIDLFGPGPIELFKGFNDRKARRLDAALRGPVLAPERFALDQTA